MRTKFIQFFTTFFAILIVLSSFTHAFKSFDTVASVYAQPQTGDPTAPTPPQTGDPTAPNPPQTGDPVTSVTLPNPTGFGNICELINAFITIIAEVGAVIAVLFIIWSGFLFVMAQGNPQKLSTAKNTFLTTIIGTAILVGAAIITKIIVNTVMSITAGVGGGGGICSS